MTEKPGINALLSLLILAVGLPMGATADQATKQALKIAIDDGTPHGQLFINLDDAETVSLHDMQVGESRSIIDDSGRSILVTRTDQGLEINVDGRVIQLPAIDDGMDVHLAGDAETVNIEKKMVFVSKAGDADKAGITIISGRAIDESTRDSIRSLLASAGYETDVRFIDSSKLQGADGDAHAGMHHRHIRVLTEERDATN
jgi:hypothetical protein